MTKAAARATLAYLDATAARNPRDARSRRLLADQCRRRLKGKGVPLGELRAPF